jgi:predicted transcriptional regulator
MKILMKYRSRTDISAQILDAAVGGGATKTKIMYKAFLSYTQLRDYLDILIANGLIDYDHSDQTFKTTEKGHKFLKLYIQIGELAPVVTEEAIAGI